MAGAHLSHLAHDAEQLQIVAPGLTDGAQPTHRAGEPAHGRAAAAAAAASAAAASSTTPAATAAIVRSQVDEQRDRLAGAAAAPRVVEERHPRRLAAADSEANESPHAEQPDQRLRLERSER